MTVAALFLVLSTAASAQTARVTSLSELQAQTADERGAAPFFNVGGGPLIPGAERHVIEEHGASWTGLYEQFFPPPDVTALSPADAEVARERYRREREDRLKEEAGSTFRDRVCRSTAVVVARPLTRNVLLSAAGDFLFTHYVATVERWIRPAAERRTSVDIATAGGAVLVANQLLNASVSDLRMPNLNERAVFYLAAIEGSNWYASGSPTSLAEPGEADLVARLTAAAAACQ